MTRWAGGNVRRSHAPRSPELRYAWRILSATSLGVLLSGANASTLDVALPVVARHFRAGASAASWALLSYLLVYTVLLLVFGRLADLIGRRRLYLFGLAVLTFASMACGLAPNIETLDVLRGLQAIGAAAIITNVTALLTDAFPHEHLAFGLGLNVTMGGAAQVSGPLIGGFLASELGWRAVFWFNVPTGVVAMIWAHRALRADRPKPTDEPFDVVSSVVCVIMLAGTMVAVSEGRIVGWDNPLVITALVAAAAAIPVFAVLQRRRRFPLIAPELFRNRDRAMAYAAGFVLAGIRYGVVLLVALYLQAVRGESAFSAGLHVIPVAVGMMMASPLAGRLARSYGARLLATTGLGLCGIGITWLSIELRPRGGYAPLLPALLCVGVGVGLFLTPNTSAIMASVSPDRRGIANGVRQLAQQSGAAISTAFCLAVITGPLTPSERRAAYSGQLSLEGGPAVNSFTNAYRLTFLLLLVCTIAAMAASMMRSPPPTRISLPAAVDS